MISDEVVGGWTRKPNSQLCTATVGSNCKLRLHIGVRIRLAEDEVESTAKRKRVESRLSTHSAC